MGGLARIAAVKCAPEPMTDPAILFLHGIPDSGRSWHGVIDHLPSSYRCFAPDIPGFGDSAPPSRLETLDDLRASVDAIVAALALPPRLTLVVHDAGGLFGLAWAAMRPERIDRLIILNTSIFPDRRWHWGARILRTPRLGDIAMRRLPRRAFRAEMRRASNGNLSPALIDRIFDGFGPVARRTALTLYRMQAPALLESLPEAVHRFTERVPTLVLWGGADPYLPRHFAERFGAATVRIFDGLGHWPHQEDPAQLAADIGSFLDRAKPPGLRAT